MSSEDKIDVYTSSEDKIQAESSDYTLPQEHTAKKTFFSSFIESFQRADENEFDEHNNGKSVQPTFSQLETSVSNQLVGNITNKNTLKRNIKPRHQFMISIGTGVGTGMLVSTGSALRQAGPANLFIAFAIVSSFIYTTYNSISELAVVYRDYLVPTMICLSS